MESEHGRLACAIPGASTGDWRRASPGASTGDWHRAIPGASTGDWRGAIPRASSTGDWRCAIPGAAARVCNAIWMPWSFALRWITVEAWSASARCWITMEHMG